MNDVKDLQKQLKEAEEKIKLWQEVRDNLIKMIIWTEVAETDKRIHEGVWGKNHEE